jgi:hypothetical protein
MALAVLAEMQLSMMSVSCMTSRGSVIAAPRFACSRTRSSCGLTVQEVSHC